MKITPWLQLVASVSVRLRGEYMWRQQRAMSALNDKLRALRALADTHGACLAQLQSEAAEVKKQSAALRERCARADTTQDDLKYRCSAVIRACGAASASSEEKQLVAQLREMRRRADTMSQRLQATKMHVARRDQELKQWKEDYKRKDTALGKSHSDTIASILQQQTSQISAIIEETKLLKDQLSIV